MLSAKTASSSVLKLFVVRCYNCKHSSKTYDTQGKKLHNRECGNNFLQFIYLKSQMRHHYGVTSTLIRFMPHTIHVYLAENTPICRMVFGKTGQRKVSRSAPPSLKSLSYSWLKNKIHLDAAYYFIMLMLGSTPLCPLSGAHDDSLGYHIGRLVLEFLLAEKLSAGTMDESPDRRL